ncbi:putative quinol monooxygenase [Halorarius litoreus]|uniref:putative quinol monooxygenase n=1 Tax=Halorarius litoreus TaxID=2962676 RepID=UPI0020CDCFF0|nr:putative quinol monooxygenase [Halorarius litoreus]
MIVLNATIPVDPERREQAVDAATTLAQASREEDGVIDYRVTADLEDENVIRIFEQYENDDAVNAHMESDHFLTFQGQVPEFAGGQVELHRFDGAEKSQMM